MKFYLITMEFVTIIKRQKHVERDVMKTRIEDLVSGSEGYFLDNH